MNMTKQTWNYYDIEINAWNYHDITEITTILLKKNIINVTTGKTIYDFDFCDVIIFRNVICETENNYSNCRL